jgi:predicted PurR-regulated permease PerM
MQMKISSFLQSLLTLVLVSFILVFAKSFLIPLVYSLFIAIIIYPMCKFLELKGVNRGIAIFIPLILVCVLFAGLIMLLSYEMAVLSGKWPLLQEKIYPVIEQLQDFLYQKFGWTTQEQMGWIVDGLKRLSENAGAIIQETSKATFEAILNLVIIPIYITLILIYRGKIVTFVTALAPLHYKEKIPAVLNDTIVMFSKFIRGMVVVYMIVGILNTLGLWIIGVENPLVYGMLTAIMTIIPYFGIMISALLPITMSWLSTGTIWQPLGVITIFTSVQYLEANLVFPYVVGKHVNLNTLVSILVIFIGGLIWGVAGMILFIPLIAMFRIFAEHFPETKHWSDFLKK